jgi:hypothetical protein
MTSQRLVAPLVAALLLSSAFASPAGHSLVDDGWDVARAMLVAGSPVSAERIALVRGIAVRDDITLTDGTLEADLDVPRTSQFAGFAFRLANTANYDIIYFRGDGNRWQEVQYQAVFDGEPTWQLYTGPGYNTDLTPERAPLDAPMHVKIVFAAARADVFVNHSADPVLRVAELARAPQNGRVGVWAAGGPAARMTFDAYAATKRIDAPLAPIAAARPLPGQIMRWRVSARLASPDTIVAPAELTRAHRAALRAAKVVTAESSGLVNLSRIVGNPAGPQVENVLGGAGWGLALASTTLTAKRVHTARLRFAYSEGITVFLNGRRVFAGTNSYASTNLGRVVADANTVELPLAAGANELVLAVTDRAFGWGFRARLDEERE